VSVYVHAYTSEADGALRNKRPVNNPRAFRRASLINARTKMPDRYSGADDSFYSAGVVDAR